ncbi:MAG: hypothetical protein HOF10_13370 [Chloroflexi bacterium]|nr:hypothetical protein [Chloroflexota bacterium]MBT4004290.1 hypothetical protein [Chloroflexota bacterium]MBT4305713.1 hypothetical protein [Chloroflexota bacterium]MBT4533537.1 hypothetical protein [Chloroflexota bacterium]MBT4681820.1 hypothetical protein [Chloroflexota bacterium]
MNDKVRFPPGLRASITLLITNCNCAPSRTEDGSTFFAVNSHQPWEGPVTWYEAHLHSEENWNVTGALFPGAPAVIQGHNEVLSWAFTVNDPDLTDIYVLEINPDNENQYLFDGNWLDFEIREVPIKVKLIGNLKVTVKQEALWSVFGPTIRQDHGAYAIRYSGFGRVDIFQQLVDLNKSANFEEWQTAMYSGALPTFNVGYADNQGNIYFLYNANLPICQLGQKGINGIYTFREHPPMFYGQNICLQKNYLRF